MKLSIIAHPVLLPYIELLSPSSPHQIDAVCLPDFSDENASVLQDFLAQTHGYDAVILATGCDLLPDEGVIAGDCPLVIPRIHNLIALLLGGAETYRRLFAAYDGGICWIAPAMEHELLFTPRADCACLCYIADTCLGLPDTSLAARACAAQNGWDFLQTEGDPSLIARLLCGQWEGESILVAAPHAHVYPTCQQNLISLTQKP